MISGTFRKYLNTLFGFLSNGDIMCVPCGERKGVRRRLNAGQTKGDESCLSGVDFYNGGQDAEEDAECPGCGEEVDVRIGEHTKCCDENAMAKWSCVECGDTLAENAEA